MENSTLRKAEIGGLGPKVVLERNSGVKGTSKQVGWVPDILAMKERSALEHSGVELGRRPRAWF